MDSLSLKISKVASEMSEKLTSDNDDEAKDISIEELKNVHSTVVELISFIQTIQHQHQQQSISLELISIETLLDFIYLVGLLNDSDVCHFSLFLLDELIENEKKQNKNENNSNNNNKETKTIDDDNDDDGNENLNQLKEMKTLINNQLKELPTIEQETIIKDVAGLISNGAFIFDIIILK